MYTLHKVQSISCREGIRLILLHFHLFSCFVFSNSVVHALLLPEKPHSTSASESSVGTISFGMFYETEKWKFLRCLYHVSCKKNKTPHTLEIKMTVLRWFCLGSLAALRSSVSCEAQLSSWRAALYPHIYFNHGLLFSMVVTGFQDRKGKGCKVYGSLDSGTHILMVKITWLACLKEVHKETLSGLCMREATWLYYKGRGSLRWEKFVIIKQWIAEAIPVHFLFLIAPSGL